MKHGRTGKPAKTKGKPGPDGTASQRGRKSSFLQAPSGDPRGHIQRWLIRTKVDDAATPERTRGVPGGSHGRAPGACQLEFGCGPGIQPASWRSPGIPGSSTGSPPSGRRPGAGASLSSPRGIRVPAIAACRGSGGPPRRAVVGAGSTTRIWGGHPPGRLVSALRRARCVRRKALPRACPSFRICLCPSPGGGVRQVLPLPGRRGTGQLEPD